MTDDVSMIKSSQTTITTAKCILILEKRKELRNATSGNKEGWISRWWEISPFYHLVIYLDSQSVTIKINNDNLSTSSVRIGFTSWYIILYMMFDMQINVDMIIIQWKWKLYVVWLGLLIECDRKEVKVYANHHQCHLWFYFIDCSFWFAVWVDVVGRRKVKKIIFNIACRSLTLSKEPCIDF